MTSLHRQYPKLQRLRLRWTMLGIRGKATIIVLLVLVVFSASYQASVLFWPEERYVLPVERTCQDAEDDSHDASTPTTAKPLIILVSGGSRTGTTYLYNLVRILLRQRDPNTISGWYEDLSYAAGRYASPDPPISPILDSKLARKSTFDVWNGALDSYRNTGTTVLVKVHSLAHATRLFTGCDGPEDIAADICPIDLVVYSHRDLCSQIASIRRMGWGNSVTRDEILSDPAEYCRRRKDATIGHIPRLNDEDWHYEKTWTNQALAIMACHKEWLSAVGEKLAADVPMGDVNVELAEKLIKKIKKAEGDRSTGSLMFEMDPIPALAEAKALRPLACSSHVAVNPITHYHRGHVVASAGAGGIDEDQQLKDEEDKKRGCTAIKADRTLLELSKHL